MTETKNGLGLETTAEERDYWLDLCDGTHGQVGLTANNAARLLHDIDRILAKLAEAQSERDQFIEKWKAAGSAATRRQVEIDRIKTEATAREATARAEERKACAKIADAYARGYPLRHDTHSIAAAIRARSQT